MISVSRPVTRGSEAPLENFLASLEKFVGYILKLLDIVQKICALSENSSPSWRLKLVTGLSVSHQTPVLVEIILSVSENYPKVNIFYDAQYTCLCYVYFALSGKSTAGVTLPLAEHDWLK